MLRDKALVPLSHQHQHALALCVQIDRSLAADDGSDNLKSLAATVAHHFDTEMRRHFDVEERVLFPALAALEETADLIRLLLIEHRRMEVLRDAVCQVEDGVQLAEFSALVRAHVRKEEGVLFETAQRLLSRDELESLGERLDAGLH